MAEPIERPDHKGDATGAVITIVTDSIAFHLTVGTVVSA